MAIPLNKIPDLPSSVFEKASEELVVIDTRNYYPRQRDGRLIDIENGELESVWVQKHLGHPVIKVFNSIEATSLIAKGKPAGAADRVALAVAGDSVKAKAIVTRLLDEIGYDAVDAGALTSSWRQQPGTPGYLKDLNKENVRAALMEASPERTKAWRATDNSPGDFENQA